MPSPNPLDPTPSPAAERRRRRTRDLKRTLIGCGALFAVLFCLLAAQMVLGRDPAVGDGARGAQTASVPASGSNAQEHGSWVDVALGVVQALASDDEHGDEDSGSSAPLQSRSS